MTRRLTRAEAAERSALIYVAGYDIELDLNRGTEFFVSRCRITFGCRTPGAATFVECLAADVHRVVLNGVALYPGDVWSGDRIRLDDLAAHNTLEIEADHRYSRDGQGLQRFVDPADDRVYMYSQSEAYDAHRIFACFDQPDIKAPVTLTVRAPEHWTVLSTATAEVPEPRLWRAAGCAIARPVLAGPVGHGS